MSTGQILTIVGGVVGYAITGTPVGFQVGALVGGVAGSIIDQPTFDTPKVGDLKAPQVQYGSPLVRLYGTNWTSGVLAWYSTKRVIPGDSGGKGDPSPPTADTAEIDVLFLFSIDSPVIAITRVKRNGELIWTNRDDSDATSIFTSPSTDAWTSMTFLDGNPAQLPHPVIEAFEGVGNAPAYRHRQGVLIEGLNLGQSGQLPLLEFECITNGVTSTTVDVFADLPAYPHPNGTIGMGTPAFSNTGFQVWVGQWDNSYANNDVVVYDIAADGSVSRAGLVTVPSNNSSGKGNSDESGMLNASDDWETIYWTWSLEGFYATFELPSGEVLGQSQIRFSKVGTDFVFGSLSFGARKLYRYTRTSPAPQATSVDLSTVSGCSGYFASIAIGADKVYALDVGGALIVQLTLATLAVETTFATPSTYANNAAVICDEEGRLYYADGAAGTLSKRSGAGWDQLFSGISGAIDSSQFVTYGFREGTFFSYGGPPTFAPTYRLYVRRVLSPVSVLPADLADVVEAEWSRVDDDSASHINATDLEGIAVRGFQTGGSVRGALEALAPIFHFGAVCYDKVYFKRQGGAPVATLAFEDLAAGENQASDAPFDPEFADDSEVLERAVLTYPNISDDGANGTETGNRGTGASNIVQTFQTNVVMTPSEAKAVAESYAAIAGAAAMTATITVTEYHAPLGPTDVIRVPDEDGNLHRMRIGRETYGGGVKSLELVRDDATALVAPGITSDDYTQSLTVQPPAVTQLLLVDTAIWRDVDDNAGFYAAAKGSPRGATLYSSTDGVDYTQAVVFTAQSVFGICATTLTDWAGGFGFDNVSSLIVDVGAGTLSSATPAALIADRTLNACAIGVHGRWELCQFRTPTLLSPGLYLVTGFLRGLNGTEWACTGHGANESFLLISAAAARRVIRQPSEIGVAEFYKGVSAGRLLSSAPARSFTDTAVGLKPYAVVDLRKTSSGTVVAVAWDRRSRLAFRLFAAGIAPPLAEAVESYDVELYYGASLVSSETVYSPAWAAATANQTGNLLVPSTFLQLIGGEIVGISDADIPGQTAKFTRHDTTGAGIAVSAVLGSTCYQWTNDGDELYACTADLTTTSPSVYLNSKIQRVSRTDLSTVVATYTAAFAGDLHGVACDGTDLWCTEWYSGNLRRLDKTTLASVATYAIDTQLDRLYHYAGSLWICSSYTDEVIEWDIATTSEINRYAVVAGPTELLIVGSNLFVRGSEEVGVYDAATGALINAVAAPRNCKGLVEFGACVAASSSYTVVLIDAITGLQARIIETAVRYLGVDYSYLWNVAGANGSALYITLGGPGKSPQTVAFELSAPDLTGYSVVVYQNSATVGRGYPATLDL